MPPWCAFLSCRQSPYAGSKRSPSDAGLEIASRPGKRELTGSAQRGFQGTGDGEKWDAMKARTALCWLLRGCIVFQMYCTMYQVCRISVPGTYIN